MAMVPHPKGQAVAFGSVIAGAALLALLLTYGDAPRRSATVVLAEVAVVDGRRSVQPRLSFDFPHAAFDAASIRDRAATLTSKHPRLLSEMLALPAQKGLRDLLLGNPAKAIEQLKGVDLAAAYYMRGLSSESVNDFARALQALNGVHESPAATFNRALIFEQLSDAEAAAGEWRKYLAADATSAWAEEARQHLADTSRRSTPEAWKAEKPLLIDAAAAENMPRVRELVARYPLGARHLVELEMLPAWGEALSRGDTQTAERSLVISRRCVSLLAQKGEHLLRDAIREIDAATAERKASLARGYVAYGEAHEKLENADHDGVLTRASEALRLGSGSPAFVALIADDVATALYRKYDYAGAQTLIDQTRTKYAGHSADYIALFARLDWLGGLIQFVRGDASESLHSYKRSLAAYETLEEVEYQAAQQVNLASALAYLGENERAAVHLRKALTLGSRAEDPRRLYAPLKTAADAALEDAAPAAALIFQDRFVRVARLTGERLRIADAVVTRSSILSRAGQRAEALRDVAEVNRLAQEIPDLPSRRRLQADAAIAEAFAHRDVDDRAAVVSITRAVDLLRGLEVPMSLAQLLLERGRAYLRLGETSAAEADFRAGIEELEHQRRMVKESELRVTYLDRADRLFVDLALLQMRRGQAEEAFDLLERLRSRELLDRSSGKAMTPMSVSEIRSRLSKNTILVSYTLAAQTLVTCVVTRDGVRAFEQASGEATVVPLLDGIAAGFAAGDPQLPQRELRRLAALLIDGVAPPSGSRIVFVPDRLLYSAPFSALRATSGRYLVEEQTIVVAPSATLYVRNCDRDRMLRKRGEPSILAVASPQIPKGFDDLQPLTRAPEEARKIAGNYTHHRTIIASEDQPLPLLSIAGNYDVVHMASHSFVDRRTPARSALLIGESGRITAADIESASLSRVRLVVLGGCSTGVGKSHRSEGAMSLARAFLAASVPSVIGTVAPIEDEAAERLLTKFHRAYSGGLDAAAALRRAQLQMLNSGNLTDANPARWAAFEVIGGAYAPEREREEVAKVWPLR